MKCGACNTKLTKEAEAYVNGKADWWICKKCNVARELGPYDMPETAVEQELWDKLFKGKKYFQRLDWSLERFTDSAGLHYSKKE